jgi:hypothetical protein
VAEFLTDYVSLPEMTPLVIAAWVTAAWMLPAWDRFPHLCISSPEKRSGKTRLLELLNLIVPKPLFTSNISPAALYRTIEKTRPTLLFDEAQSLSRPGSEAGEVMKEILNAGIGKDSKVVRCQGKNHEAKEFSIYSPKVFAMIGYPDGVLADRSLPVPMRRKTDTDEVQRYRSRTIEPRGHEIRDQLKAWSEENSEYAALLYDALEPFDIENDRMAELLLPLQCVLRIEGGEGMETLERYAFSLDERDKQKETQSPSIQLLVACREIMKDAKFIPTAELIEHLVSREEEPWQNWNRGAGLNPESLAKLLRPYGIKANPDKRRKIRGYYVADFADAWKRYLSP